MRKGERFLSCTETCPIVILHLEDGQETSLGGERKEARSMGNFDIFPSAPSIFVSFFLKHYPFSLTTSYVEYIFSFGYR